MATSKAVCHALSLGLAFFMGCVITLGFLLPGPDCICPLSGRRNRPENLDSSTTAKQAGALHRMAVLVPFRDRFDELLQFVPYMSKFLNRQGRDHKIFVLNQVDRYRFNRASLINVGFIFTNGVFDYIAMHDVDLLPLNDDLQYEYPTDTGPLHIASPALHPRYHYKNFVGGILLVRCEHFRQLNGMSNQYWGWGLEDDEFFVRIRDAGMHVSRPKNILTGTNDTFKHIHDRQHRKRDTQKCFNQKEITRQADRHSGVHDVKYKILSLHDVTIDGYNITVLNIELECDRTKTPWCDCSGQH